MNITNRAHNKRYSYPIAHTKKPVVICTNITSGDVDRDGWATSGTYSVTDTGFTYISAQNQTEGFQWLSIGEVTKGECNHLHSLIIKQIKITSLHCQLPINQNVW